jgi:hypothetical protein
LNCEPRLKYLFTNGLQLTPVSESETLSESAREGHRACEAVPAHALHLYLPPKRGAAKMFGYARSRGLPFRSGVC